MCTSGVERNNNVYYLYPSKQVKLHPLKYRIILNYDALLNIALAVN
jgi:hypothetical protein